MKNFGLVELILKFMIKKKYFYVISVTNTASHTYSLIYKYTASLKIIVTVYQYSIVYLFNYLFFRPSKFILLIPFRKK